jgi:hypothetical protein
MRMWNVDPELLCRQHLLGEHVECHMFAGCIIRGKRIEGYIRDGLVEVHNLRQRHNILAFEMQRRGYKHASPFEIPEALAQKGSVDKKANLKELARRCPECRKRIKARKAQGEAA